MQPLGPAVTATNDNIEWPEEPVCYFGNLPFSAKERDIEDFIKDTCGFYPEDVYIQLDRDGRPSGYATIDLRDMPDLKKVFLTCDGVNFRGRPVRTQLERNNRGRNTNNNNNKNDRHNDRRRVSSSSSVESRRRNSSASDSDDGWQAVGSKVATGSTTTTTVKKNISRDGNRDGHRRGGDDRRRDGGDKKSFSNSRGGDRKW